MKILNYILIIVSVCLPILICWKFTEVSQLPSWIWFPGTIIPLACLYLVAKKSEREGWEGLKDTGTAFYYGTWAVEVSILAGILAFCWKDYAMIVSLMKAAAGWSPEMTRRTMLSQRPTARRRMSSIDPCRIMQT